MDPSSWLIGNRDAGSEVLWKDAERLLYRSWRADANGDRQSVLVVLPVPEHPTSNSLTRLTHEYEIKDDLNDAWSARPLELVRERGQTILVLKDPGGEPLDRLIGSPMKLGRFLRLAVGLVVAIGRLHERGFVHRDLKPTNILVNSRTGQAWLTGFGISSRLQRERWSPDPPEFLAGTLAYMAPEQTGRMNRSIDSRSDLYSLGVTLYQMLTGSLPFKASDPMEWLHCHIARKAVAPIERLENIPAPVSAIIMKLLAKTGEERYQTAAGLNIDLRRCLAEWEAQDRVGEFPLGEHDTPDRLLTPEKLYGRESEISALLASFDRVVTSGTPELVLVSGYSGIGKSSVVNELHKVLVPPRGLFASGKFDQYKRDTPYATLVQALEKLVHPLLSKREAELHAWRDALLKAVGPNGQLIVELVPELKLIIGEQPPVTALSPQDTQRRFRLVFRRFIGVFARAEHPLALFLDDLQWLDAATLDVLEDLLTQPDVRHLMLIGAYRDNEVDSTHPLIRKLKTIRSAGGHVQDVVLAPLSHEDVKQLIVDSLRCEPESAAPLADLVYKKTAGNPFFSIQFVSSLAEDGLISFDHRKAQWVWDLKQIHAKGYTDNVADLMVEKLHRLPAGTQSALRKFACLGNSADFAVLMVVFQETQAEVHHKLREAVRAGLIFRSEASYKFHHDRIQEAAYSLIPERARAGAHLRIGRLLAAQTSPEELHEAIFEIVNQLNRGTNLVASAEERNRVAELNCIAGRRAKASTAYASALKYLATGRALLTEDTWDKNHELIFSIECLTAECEMLTGDMESAEKRLLALAARCKSGHHLAVTTRLQLTLYTALDRLDRGIELCLAYLRRSRINWSAHPTVDEVQREHDRIWSILGDRQIEDLLGEPLLTDPDTLDVLDVLTELITPAVFFDQNLCALVICRVLNVSLQYGHSESSPFAYVWFGIIAGPRFGNYKDAFRFAQLGYDLLEKRGLKRYEARTCMCFGSIIVPWTRHVRRGRDLLLYSFDLAHRTGDFTYAAYSFTQLVTNYLVVGDPLDAAQVQAEKGIEFARETCIGLVADIITSDLQLIRSLRGLTSSFGSFNDNEFDEARFERYLASNPALADPEFGYWTLKIEALFFAGDYASAVDASLNAQKLLWAAPSLLEPAAFHFYSALSRAGCWDSASLDLKPQHFEALASHQKQLQVWAENCPENFENRVALVGAEIARIEGRDLDAMRLYEQAIWSARANGFVHNEAIGNEIAARFYLARDFSKIAHAYLRDARDCYLQWGADGKVQQLEELYPHLRQQRSASGPTSTMLTSVERLDLATVIKLSQSISGEIVRENLFDTLMRTAIEHAGAERALLIHAQGDVYRVLAEATIGSDGIAVGQPQTEVSADDLPVSVLNYVTRTKERIVIHDASQESQFSDDEYIRRHHALSILCLPLLKQTRLIGVLYLENNLIGHVFSPAKMAVLTLLASETAISLENMRLYDDLQNQEAKIRRLIDSNIVGIFNWDLDGRILDANDAFLRIVGYDREDLASGRLRWTELTPPEWRDRDAQRWLPELKTSGSLQPYEKEYFRKDGSRVPILIGAASFREGDEQGVAFVLDLTDRKRAEAEARESEQRYREVQMELAHANRVATMGQLSASIAHEINQPIGAAITYADAGLRWLDADPPNLEEVRQAFGVILESSVRAGEVMDRIRALVRKAPLEKASLEINEVILEVITLTSREVEKNGISAQIQLAESLPAIHGDRVQLQQVLLNLLINAIEALSGMSEGQRELLISTAKSDSGVVVSVRDSGPGLMPESVERLFESFYTTKPGGLGMGLSICRSIIEAHGGRLWVSANEPRGAVFQFTLTA